MGERKVLNKYYPPDFDQVQTRNCERRCHARGLAAHGCGKGDCIISRAHHHDFHIEETKIVLGKSKNDNSFENQQIEGEELNRLKDQVKLCKEQEAISQEAFSLNHLHQLNGLVLNQQRIQIVILVLNPWSFGSIFNWKDNFYKTFAKNELLRCPHWTRAYNR
ncbi:uncharacterized protein LOC126726289 isoform X4 [Quercus robur]|uniref:uncharacterized protein LOC126726289 isoform X4 n=1 Tax=Quercus robur TaxID=38942 RepID=UPI00216353DB|nr:uncharacterized protein LOC126726289 isoform X4 [Quercus robur]